MLTWEGCKKGKRECNYADPVNTSKSRSKTSKSKTKAEPESDEEDTIEEDKSGLPTIVDEDESGSQGQTPDEPDSVGSSRRKYKPENSSRTPSLTTDQGQSPSSSSGYSGASPKDPERSDFQAREGSPIDQKSLPPDVKFYLNYFVNNVTSDHYSFKASLECVLHNDMLQEAFKYEPLLQAIVGFSAYLYTLENPDGRIQDFLQYYNKAVSLLLRNIKKGTKSTLGTLLTILQLTCIEVRISTTLRLRSNS